MAIAALVGWLVGRRRTSVGKAVSNELDAIEQAEAVDRIAAKQSAELANKLADLQHAQTLERLSAEQKRVVDDLRDNPRKRILYLRRIADRLRE